MNADILTIHTEASVVTATLNRPDKANALSRAMLDALDRLAATVESAAEVADGPRALVITGAGPTAFSAGADITELAGLDRSAAREQMKRGQRVFDRLECLPVAVIAAVNGAALGGGLELAMAADIRIAATDARFGQPEISLGNLPGWGGTQRLPGLIGRGPATELILTGDLISAQRALALGLVNRLTDDCLPDALELAGRIAAHSRHAIRGAKRALRTGLRAGIAAGLEAEADAVAECCQTAEQHAAVQAFLRRKSASR